MLVITGVGLALQGCESARPFQRITWQPTELDGVGAPAVQERQVAYVYFDDGPLATTEMACADGVVQEQAFLAALAAVDGWRTVERQTLEFLGARGEALVRFTVAPRK